LDGLQAELCALDVSGAIVASAAIKAPSKSVTEVSFRIV
jgi:hypothetical protein